MSASQLIDELSTKLESARSLAQPIENGLAIVEAISEAMNATESVSSVPSNGVGVCQPFCSIKPQWAG